MNFGIVVVEFCDVGPVVFDYGFAERVAVVPTGILFSYPWVIRGGVVCDPVQDDLEAKVVGCGQELVEVFQRAEFGIYVAVVAYRVV